MNASLTTALKQLRPSGLLETLDVRLPVRDHHAQAPTQEHHDDFEPAAGERSIIISPFATFDAAAKRLAEIVVGGDFRQVRR
jgi:hypothetical protein